MSPDRVSEILAEVILTLDDVATYMDPTDREAAADLAQSATTLADLKLELERDTLRVSA